MEQSLIEDDSFPERWKEKPRISASKETIRLHIQADGKILSGECQIQKLLHDDMKINNITDLFDMQTAAEMHAYLGEIEAGKSTFWMNQYVLNIRDTQRADVVVHISRAMIAGCYNMLIYPLVQLACYEQLKEKAYTDELTGISNFRKFKEDLVQRMEASDRTQSKFGLIFLDVDSFKQINDRRGHLAGDETLKECARRLLESAALRNAVYRKSGDEFLVIVDDASDLESVQMNIEDAFSNVFHVENSQFLVQISTGVGIYPDQGRTMDELMEHSDKALYQVKRIKRMLRHEE